VGLLRDADPAFAGSREIVMSNSKLGITSFVFGVGQMFLTIIFVLASLRIINLEYTFISIPLIIPDFIFFSSPSSFPVILPLLGLILGIIGLSMPNTKRTLAVSGIILNLLVPLLHYLFA